MYKHRFTKEILEAIWENRQGGMTWIEISDKWEIPDTSIRQALKDAGIYIPRPKAPDGCKLKPVSLVASGKPSSPNKVYKNNLRILTLDIENAPMMSYHWGLWKQNIGRPMRIEENRSYMMSIAMKWLGEDEVHYFETRTEDDSELIEKVLDFLHEADLIIGHNAKRFDMKKINAYAVLNGLKPPSPYRVIDTMLIAKKEFSFEQNTLEYLTGALCKEKKSGHGKFKGFALWSECMKGNEEAWAEMKFYNKQDVISTEELYLVLRPWAKSHPNVTTGATDSESMCPTCGSHKLKRKGYSTTNVSRFARFKCGNCGSWSRGRKSILHKENRANLLVSIANG